MASVEEVRALAEKIARHKQELAQAEAGAALLREEVGGLSSDDITRKIKKLEKERLALEKAYRAERKAYHRLC